METQIFKALLNQSKADGSRTSVLAPLQWIFGLSIAGLIINVSYKNDTWLTILLSAIAIISILIYFFYFVFFAHKNPDYLRSEKYSLSKMAIEKGLIGDSSIGLFEPLEDSDDKEPPALIENRGEA